jgi:hypothetical protein
MQAATAGQDEITYPYGFVSLDWPTFDKLG